MNEPNENQQRDNIPQASLARAFEQRDVGLRGLIVSMVLLAALLVGAWLSMDVLLDAFTAREVRNAPSPSPLGESASPPQPRLETEPGALLEQLRSVEDALLNSYAWSDRSTETVRIPIDRAIEVIAERGLPAVAPSAPQQDDAGDGNDAGGRSRSNNESNKSER